MAVGHDYRNGMVSLRDLPVIFLSRSPRPFGRVRDGSIRRDGLVRRFRPVLGWKGIGERKRPVSSPVGRFAGNCARLLIESGRSWDRRTRNVRSSPRPGPGMPRARMGGDLRVARRGRWAGTAVRIRIPPSRAETGAGERGRPPAVGPSAGGPEAGRRSPPVPVLREGAKLGRPVVSGRFGGVAGDFPRSAPGDFLRRAGMVVLKIAIGSAPSLAWSPD